LENIATYLFPENTRKRCALDTRNLRRAIRPEEFSKPCRQERGHARIGDTLPAVHHRLSCQGRYRAYRAHPSQFAGLAMMSGAISKLTASMIQLREVCLQCGGNRR